MVDAYINRKHGREKPTYVHPILEEILSETFGVLVYQEQCMRVLNRLGGIELADAYACIKAISKKKEEIINARRADFIAGAQQRGVPAATATEIFDLIVHFGGYGFNKSHSAAYAQLGYQTAYLKAHYPAEFMAALLSSEIDDSNKRDIMVQHIDDARRLGAEVLPPNIQEGVAEFTVRAGRIVFGLLAIKGLGRGAIEEIVRARNDGGPFRDFFDFCERVDHKLVPKTGIERLVKAGAFDGLRAKRAALWEALPHALAAASQAQRDRKLGQLSLFDEPETTRDDEATDTTLPQVPEWQPLEKLKHEKEALDFYVSSHPLGQFEDVLRRFATHRVDDLPRLDAGTEVFLGGMLTQLRLMNTKKARNGNTRYARFKLEDFSGAAECVMWPDDYARFTELVEEDAVRFVAASVEKTRDEPGLVITRLLTLEQAKKERTQGLLLTLDLSDNGETLQRLERVGMVLQRSPGNLPVFIDVLDGAGNRLTIRAGDAFRVHPDKVPIADLETLLGKGRVEFARAGR
jgi:DNA polymerase-3 subunit alpha